MKVALLSDIHGNLLALEAVLADIEAHGGVDAYWLLGDFCTVGYNPGGVLDRLNELPNTVFIRGNGDRYIASGHRPRPTIEDVYANISLLPNLVEVSGSFAWTSGYVTACGWSEWMSQLPLEYTLNLPNGIEVLLVHAEPGMDDGPGLVPILSDDDLRVKMDNCAADLICVGHFHVPMDRTINGKRIVNPGSVSNPLSKDGSEIRPSYAVLMATEEAYHITFHRVNYDQEAAVEAVKKSGIPGSDFVVRCLAGQIEASWLKKWDGISYLPKSSDNL